MQVLFEGSDEDPEEGLGVLPGRARRLPRQRQGAAHGMEHREWTATHPYVDGIPDDDAVLLRALLRARRDRGLDASACTNYGRPFSAAVARDNVFATQFHPEKSGEAGLQIYERFVKDVAAA